MRSCVANILKFTNYSCKSNVSIRHYPRWTHRQPKRVIYPEEYEQEDNNVRRKVIQPKNLDDNIIELNSSDVYEEPILHKPNRSVIKNIRPKKLTDIESFDSQTHFEQKINNKQNKYEEHLLNSHKPSKSLMKNVKPGKLIDIESLDAQTYFEQKLDKKPKKIEIKHTKNEVLCTTFDKDGNYVYEKMKNNDPKIGTLMLIVKSKKLRNKEECILLEGKRLIREGLLAKCTLQQILFSRKPDLDFIKDLLPKKNIQLYKLAYKDLQMWSDLTTCPGIMGIFKTPKLEEMNFAQNSTIPLTIICDNIREPGNLGAILRASIAVGCEKIILTKGCVDLWDPKVLRSSCGAHFRAPIHKNLDWGEIKEQITENSNIFLADNKILTSESKECNIKDLCLNVPLIPYYSVDFSNRHITLVIGGETLGLSEESYRLAFENKGSRINIPLNNNIESLNTGTALGILAFEIKRQLLLKK